MIDPEPDYDNYSLASMLDAQAHIDRELYPERAEKLDRKISERRAAGHVAFPADEKRHPIGWAWLLLIYCAFGAISSAIYLLVILSVDLKELPPEYQVQGAMPPIYLSLLSFTRSMVSLVAAISLVSYRRRAVKLFLVATILEVALVPIAFLQSASVFLGLIAIVAVLFAAAISAAFYIYARGLRTKGILEC